MRWGTKPAAAAHLPHLGALRDHGPAQDAGAASTPRPARHVVQGYALEKFGVPCDIATGVQYSIDEGCSGGSCRIEARSRPITDAGSRALGGWVPREGLKLQLLGYSYLYIHYYPVLRWRGLEKPVVPPRTVKYLLKTEALFSP
jgi:hypothetical protein